MLAGSIAPSHAFVHVVDFGLNVNIHGMAVKSGDLIHADRHGAVVVPVNTIDGMKDAAAEIWSTDCPLAALQFQQHAGVRPMHPMSILARAYRENGFKADKS